MRYIVFLLLFGQQLLATTYYVDWATGSDANNGTSTATPFKRVPGMATATGTANTTVLVSGDVIAFKGGETHFFDSVITAKSGVTYDGELWGTGRAIIDKQNISGTAISIGNAINVTIKRMVLQNIGGYAEDDPIWDGITISNVDIATDTFTSSTEHKLVVGDDIHWTKTETLPSPLIGGQGSNTKYWVVEVPSPTSFKIATAIGGPVLDITTQGTGTIKAWEPITSPPKGVGISAGASASGLLIEDVLLSEIGQWQENPPMSGIASISGQAIILENMNGATVRRAEITKSGIGIKIGGDVLINNILVDDCKIHTNMRWGVSVAPRRDKATLQNITIQKTDIYDYHQFDSGNWKGFGEKPHTDGIFLQAGSYKQINWNNIRVDGCRFWQDTARGGKGGTAEIYISAGPSVMITNCVFHRGQHSAAIKIAKPATANAGQQVVRIYNNAFLENSNPVQTGEENNIDKRYVDIRNNIFLRSALTTSVMIYQSSGVPINVLNNNLYYANNATVVTKQVASLDTYGGRKTFAQLQALGFELNGAWGNPLWPVQTGNFADIDWTIPVDSPAVSAGANLSAYFTTDALGNPRPAVGAWDLGPYISGVAPPADTTPPTLTGREVDTTGKVLTLTFSEAVEGVATAHYSISGYTLSSATGSGQTWTMAITPPVQAGAVVSLGYTSGVGRTQDLAGNLLASGTFTITNRSVEQTPDPPKPGRKGTNAKRLIRR